MLVPVPGWFDTTAASGFPASTSITVMQAIARTNTIRTQAWAAVRDQIRAAILEHGWNDQAGAFTQAFGCEDLDASSLMLAVTGFVPGDDPRMKATVDAIAARLTDKRGLVYRYLAHDGLRRRRREPSCSGRSGWRMRGPWPESWTRPLRRSSAPCGHQRCGPAGRGSRAGQR